MTYLNRNSFYNHFMIILMLLSAVLGSTIFNLLQESVEILLFILLGYGITKIKIKKSDIYLLFLFLIISIISLFYNSFFSFALNFKIYGLCVLTFIYFRENHFDPSKILNVVHIINILLILHQFITGHFIVSSAWFFGEYKTYANDRPVGIFLTPHASSFFIAIYIIYLIKCNKKYINAFAFFILTLMTNSFTSTIALLAQVVQFSFSFIGKKFKFVSSKIGAVGKSLFIIIPLVFLGLYSKQFIEALKFSSYTRYYSVEITLGQIFDSRFFADIFKIYPRNYQEYILGQEKTFADVGNEIGLIKVLIEGGIILGPVLLIVLMRNLKYYSIFIFVSLLHYSFIINMPLMLFLMIHYNARIQEYENMTDL